MPVIDVQVHAYERNHPGRPWVGHLAGPEHVTGDEMVAAMDTVGVDGAILVSPFALYRFDASYALDVYAADPGINRVLAAAAQQSLPVNMLVWGRLDQAQQLAARNPDTVIVIDHLGLQQPFHPPGPAEPWAELPKVLALAEHPNVNIKISGACTLSHEPFPYNDIWGPVLKIIDTFGVDRCMWGTDWTRATELLTYEQGVAPFRATNRLSDTDKAKLMGGTLEEVYRWAPATA